MEGKETRGWQIGSGWLMSLRGKSGNPRNVEVTLQMDTPEEAERLQRAFIIAGGEGSAPSNQLMYPPSPSVSQSPVLRPKEALSPSSALRFAQESRSESVSKGSRKAVTIMLHFSHTRHLASLKPAGDNCLSSYPSRR